MTSLNRGKEAFLLVVMRRIVPEVAALDEAGLATMLDLIEQALADRAAESIRANAGELLRQ